MSILALVAGLVGLPAIAAGVLHFLPGVGLVAKLATARGFFGRVPRPVWIALAVAAAIGVGMLWHGSRAGAAIEAAEKRGEQREKERHAKALAELERKALEIRSKAERVSAGIAQMQREQHEKDLDRIDALERALLVRGPGRAACAFVGGDPGLSAGAGERAPGRGAGGAPSTRVPYPDGLLLGVPHQWAVTTGATCDANRAEALRWREADKQQREAWERMRAEGSRR